MASLQLGYTLLSYGRRDLGRAIRMAAGGSYSHASLWTGERVIESTLPKVQEISRGALAEKSRYIDAFRHRQLDGHEHAVIDHARGYIGKEYNIAELIVGSAIGTLTAWLHQSNDWLGYNTQYSAERALSLLGRLARYHEAAAADRVTCVELVVNAHLRAGLRVDVMLDPGGEVDPAVLWAGIQDLIALARAHPQPVGREATSSRQAVASLQGDVAWMAEVAATIRAATPSANSGAALEAPLSVLKALTLPVSERWDEEGNWFSGLITPRQLSTSPSFETLGTVQPDGEVVTIDPLRDALFKD